MSNGENGREKIMPIDLAGAVRETNEELDVLAWNDLLRYFTVALKDRRPGIYLPEEISEFSTVFDGYSDVQIIYLLNSSNKKDWEKHPAFYQALINQISKRQLIRH